MKKQIVGDRIQFNHVYFGEVKNWFKKFGSRENGFDGNWKKSKNSNKNVGNGPWKKK